MGCAVAGTVNTDNLSVFKTNIFNFRHETYNNSGAWLHGMIDAVDATLNTLIGTSHPDLAVACLQ